ncbi:MBL fold metallo-hydrolase RNA specificity domain-containing protein [Diaphorobacter sp.]|uniref:MBL fold metallo-hydrolase RNA specificity domain-containing protein n=1 Tax=Diaphorobacter sp. TaxID=1934310 RepID=UPI0028ACBD38|nr:MBL fold metallo-hydrolase RNA specificity domain-containing protein [Diaphorobacter sp.]
MQRSGIHWKAKQKALLDWAAHFKNPPRKTYVMHAEADPAKALAHEMQSQLGFDAVVPQEGDVYPL